MSRLNCIDIYVLVVTLDFDPLVNFPRDGREGYTSCILLQYAKQNYYHDTELCQILNHTHVMWFWSILTSRHTKCDHLLKLFETDEFAVCEWNSQFSPFKSKLLSSTFLWCCLLSCTGGSNVWVWTKSQTVILQIKAEQYFLMVTFS